MSTWVSRPDLDDLIGPEAAEELCRSYGGVPFYVPKRVKPGEGLAARIGFGRAYALAEAFGGEYVTIPLGNRTEPLKTRIMKLLDERKSAPDIARELGTTERYVRTIMTRYRKAPRWLRLM